MQNLIIIVLQQCLKYLANHKSVKTKDISIFT